MHSAGRADSKKVRSRATVVSQKMGRALAKKGLHATLEEVRHEIYYYCTRKDGVPPIKQRYFKKNVDLMTVVKSIYLLGLRQGKRSQHREWASGLDKILDLKEMKI